VAIADIGTPRMDGFTLARNLKADPGLGAQEIKPVRVEDRAPRRVPFSAGFITAWS